MIITTPRFLPARAILDLFFVGAVLVVVVLVAVSSFDACCFFRGTTTTLNFLIA